MADAATLARYLLKRVNRAVREFNLIRDGDRIAVGLSGGKDSRTLLELLLRGVDVPGSYEVVAIHIDGSSVGLPDQKPSLEPWIRALDVPYTCIPLEIPAGEKLPLNCFRCSWNRRKALFLAADHLSCNKVAFAHHADDAAVTTLMSLMYKGHLETLAPSLSFFGGRFTVIRPLILVDESEIRRYARARGWTFPPELTCPRSNSTRRAHIAQFLSTFPDKELRQIKANLWRAARARLAESNGSDHG